MAMPTPPPDTPMRKSTPKPQYYRRKLPSTCISFSSDEGKQVFQEALHSGHMNCYFGLAAQFRTQDEPAFCGLSTLVMVLNTLEIDPKKVWKGPWRWYHENMLDCCVPLDVASKTGITIEEFACLASCNTLCVKINRADATASEEAFRNTVKNLTKVDNKVVVLSYSRKVLDQTGDGHFSPVGGYHPERDLVLVLDTARFKYPPHWVPLSLIFEAMQAKDPDTDLPRGYLQLWKNENNPLVLFRISPVFSVGTFPQHQGNSGVNAFLAEWDTWLDYPASQSMERTLDVAIQKLLHALNHINVGDTLLTTQLDIHCPERISKEHSCVVKTLVKDVEAIPLYSKVKALLMKNKKLLGIADRAGEDVLSMTLCLTTAWKLSSQIRDTNITRTTKNGCPSKVELTSAHFMTMLLLSWPASICGETNGHQLRRIVTAQLVQMHQELQNEVSQMHQQLDSLMGFIESCNLCHCDKSTACYK